MQVPVPSLERSFTLRVESSSPSDLGPGRVGQCHIIPIVGGAALGPDITGEVLNLGADGQTVYADGAAHLVTRYVVKTGDGVEIVNVGTRHGATDVMARLAAGEDVDPSG